MANLSDLLRLPNVAHAGGPSQTSVTSPIPRQAAMLIDRQNRAEEKDLKMDV